jgi:hypothetical protein
MLNHRHIHENFREHLDEVATMAGLAYIVNPLLNQNLHIIDLVAGEPRAAFKRGCELGQEYYGTDIPDKIDIAVCNAFPKDTELCQAGLGRVPLNSTKKTPLHERSSVVICSASPEGLGWHSVLGPGTALRGKASPPAHHTVLFSPGVNKWDCQALFGEWTDFCKTWPEVLECLKERHGQGAKVAVFPAGALQTASA